MPDRSYYPDADQSSIFIETTSDAAQFMKDSLLVASYRSAAQSAGVPINHTFDGKGQTIAFRNASDRAEVEESLNSLSHIERFDQGEDPSYIKAWSYIVPELLAGRGHEVSTDIKLEDQQVAVTFANDDAKQAFTNAERNGDFIEFALNRQRLMSKLLDVEPSIESGLSLDQKISV